MGNTNEHYEDYKQVEEMLTKNANVTKYVESYWRYLVEHLDTTILLDALREEGIVNSEDFQKMENQQKTSQQKTRELLETIKFKSPAAQVALCICVLMKQRHVFSHIVQAEWEKQGGTISLPAETQEVHKLKEQNAALKQQVQKLKEQIEASEEEHDKTVHKLKGQIEALEEEKDKKARSGARNRPRLNKPERKQLLGAAIQIVKADGLAVTKCTEVLRELNLSEGDINRLQRMHRNPQSRLDDGIREHQSKTSDDYLDGLIAALYRSQCHSAAEDIQDAVEACTASSEDNSLESQLELKHLQLE